MRLIVSTCPLRMVHWLQSWALLLPSNLDTCHQFSPHWKKYLLVYPQTHHDNCHCYWRSYSNHKIFNCSIETNQQKSSTVTIWYHHMQGNFPLLFPHRTNIRTFSSPHTTNNIQSFHRQLWRKNCWKTQIWPSNQNIKKHYNTTIDWNGEIFCRIKLKWDYDRKNVDISMPNYVNKALARLHHPPPIKPQHYPHTYNAPIYGHKCQFVIPTITNEKLTPAQLKNCQ